MSRQPLIVTSTLRVRAARTRIVPAAILVFAWSAFHAAALPAAQILGYYTFEGSSPSAFDDVSGAGLHPTSLGTATLNPAGFRGQAAQFVGSTALVLPLNINPSFRPTATIGAWINPTAIHNSGPWGHDDGGWDRGLDLIDGTWRMPGSSPHDSGIAATANNWHFVTVVYESATRALLYVDDAAPFVVDPHNAGSGSTNFVLGAYTTASVHPFTGLIDDFFIFDDALSLAQVRAIKNLMLEPELAYDVLQTNMLFDLYDAAAPGSLLELGNQSWSYTTGLSTGLGVVSQVGDTFFLQLASDGSGLMATPPPIIPEPASVLLLTCGLVVLANRRRRRKRA